MAFLFLVKQRVGQLSGSEIPAVQTSTWPTTRPAPSLDLGYAQNAPPIRLHSQTLAPHASIFEVKELCLIALLPLSHHLFTHPPPLNPWASSVCPHWQVHLTHFSSSPLPVPKSRPLSPTGGWLQHILKPTFIPSNHSSVQKPSVAPTVLQITPPTPRWWHGNKTLWSGWLAFSPGLALLQPAQLYLNPRCSVTWRGWSFSLPLPLPDNHAPPSGLSLASRPQSAQPGSGLSWWAGSFLCFLPVPLFSQVSIHPRRILRVRDRGLSHPWSRYLHPTLIHENVGVADCRGPPLCSGLTLQTEVWGWRGTSRGVPGLAALWLLVEYV